MGILKKPKIGEFIENELDFDFRADIIKINTIEEFNCLILADFESDKKVFYRGERKYSFDRTLLPSIYRNRSDLFSKDDFFKNIDASFLLEYYKKNSSYFNFYTNNFDDVNSDKLYSFLAFSQHYYGISPLIDFTKNLYVALSFALKNREEYKKDIVLYTLELNSNDEYTTSLEVANKWISEYNVLAFTDERLDLKNPIEIGKVIEALNEVKKRYVFDLNTPTAKLIDVPTNDLMKFQGGVFLLLDDFTLLGRNYLTKKIRNEFCIKKYIISKDICPMLLDAQRQNAKYFDFDSITDLSAVVNKLK